MSRVREKGTKWFGKQRLGVLMLGDRNCTALCFESGIIKDGASPLIGFSFLLDRIIEDAPCLLNREQLSGAIFTGIADAKRKQDYPGRPQWQELESIQSLATARDVNLRKSEIKDIDKVITMRAMEWDAKLKNLIRQVFSKSLTELHIGGGSLPFFATMIEEYFNCALNNSEEGYSPINMMQPFTPVLVNAGITDQVTEALQFKSITEIESAFATRFADVFGLIKGLMAEETKRNRKNQAKGQKKRQKIVAETTRR